MISGEPAWRLVALLRLVERGPLEAGGEDLALDAALDAWFGPNSPAGTPHRPWRCLHRSRALGAGASPAGPADDG